MPTNESDLCFEKSFQISKVDWLTCRPRPIGSREWNPWSLRWWRARDCNFNWLKGVWKNIWSVRASSELKSTKQKIISWNFVRFRREKIDTDGWKHGELRNEPFVVTRWCLYKKEVKISGSQKQLNWKDENRSIVANFFYFLHERFRFGGPGKCFFLLKGNQSGGKSRNV